MNYAVFKKYVQRIRKKTSGEYYRLMQDLSLRERHKIMFSVHVFGHSLDITDRDILSDFFTADYADVTIHCHSKEAEGELIAKMIALTGSDKVIEKVSRDRLRFVMP